MEAIKEHLERIGIYLIDMIDWSYLFLFMITSYLVLRYTGIRVKDRNKVLFVGSFYAIAYGCIKYICGMPSHNDTINMPYAVVIFTSFIFGLFLAEYGIVKIVEGIFKLVKSIIDGILGKFKNQ